jgi:tRNA (guanine37-N1)-methyltransferase
LEATALPPKAIENPSEIDRPMRFDIVTIFPEFFTGIFEHGMARRAIQAGQMQVYRHDLRAFTHDRHRTVDDRPFGGGAGMVLKPEPLAEAVESLGISPKLERSTDRQTVILLSPQGKRFTQSDARELARLDQIVLLCGRYEGVDERVNELIADRELSIGDYVLTGGELGAAVIVDAVMRLLPGVLGNDASSEFESFGLADDVLESAEGFVPRSSHGAGGLLDYPHYTRPAEFRGVAIPDVLSGGNHEQIRKWRREKALEKTLRNRPDLLLGAELTVGDREFLRKLGKQGEDLLERAGTEDSV